MAATWLFTLAPEGAFRAGKGEGSGDRVPFHSDTLQAALRCVSEESGVLAEAFAGSAPPFLVSSIYPEAGGLRLYPRPLVPPIRWDDLEDEDGALLSRAWESLDLVTESRLESLAEGRRVRFEPEDITLERVWGMPSERALRARPWRSAAEGVLLDRASGALSRFVHQGRRLAGFERLFFLARLEEPALLGPLKELVSLLGESGLGGGRSAGGGRFRLAGAHPAPGYLARPPAGDGEEPAPAMLLSLCLPSRDEVERGVLAGGAVETVLRGGWIHSGGPTRFRKRPVRMLREGSILPGARAGLAGEVRDVRPEGFEAHPVWRDGRAFAIAYRGL